MAQASLLLIRWHFPSFCLALTSAQLPRGAGLSGPVPILQTTSSGQVSLYLSRILRVPGVAKLPSLPHWSLDR